MSDRPAAPRRTCPACARRYAGLVAPDCPVCTGLGVLTLGAAALAHYEPAAIARAVELYLEDHARNARQELALGMHRAALEAAVDNLRAAGVLASTADAAGRPARAAAPVDSSSARVAELAAYRHTRELGATPGTAVLASLAAPPLDTLADARPRDGRIPRASANGHRSALATIADPIDPLGPDVAALEAAAHATTHRGRVIAAAVPTAATRRRRKDGPR